MPRRPRTATAGLVFHVVNRAAKRSVLFETPGDYAAFEQVLIAGIARRGISLFSHCVMNNHWHLVVSPQCDGRLSQFMHWVTTTHARRWQEYRGLNGFGAVYQGRYKAIAVQNDHHFLTVCRYVERNALRAGLVSRAEDWRWSSLWHHCRNCQTEWLAEWPIPRPSDWPSWVNLPQTDAELDAIRRAIRRGTPFGDETWSAEIWNRLGIKPPGPRGRPRRREK